MAHRHFWQAAVSPTFVLGAALGVAAYFVLRDDPDRDANPPGVFQTHGAGPIYALAYAPDGGSLATGAFHDRVRIWTPATRKPRGAFTDRADQTSALAFAPDSKTLAIAGIDTSVNTWEVTIRSLETGDAEAVLRGHTDKVMQLAFTPDGKLLASASLDGTVRLWDRVGNRPPLVITGTGPIHCLAFEGQGETLLTGGGGGGGGAVRRWDTTTGESLGVVVDHLLTVHRLALSPDGSTLATWEIGDLAVRLWDAKTGASRAVARGHTAFIQALQFAPDGRSLVSGGLDGTIRFWDSATGRGQTVLTSPDHVGIHTLAFSPDGKILVSGGSGASLVIWDLRKPVIDGTLAARDAGTGD